MKDKVIHGDCLEKMQDIESGSIDMVLTSPPYDNLRTYNNSLDWGEHVWKQVLKELYRVIKDGGVCVWVVGDATINGSETGTSFKQALYAKEVGFNLHDTMIYEKAQAVFGSNNCYLQSFEFMFIFSKRKPDSINFIRDRKNVRSGTERMSAGGISSGGVKKKRVSKIMRPFGKRKNIWRYGVGGGKTGHPAVFPYDLANDHIISWSNEGDLILDPFAGSGTTAIACLNLNRKYILIEKEAEYIDVINKRISEYQPRLLK